MTSVIDCPISAQANIIIPKEKFYKVGDVSSKIKGLFIDEIEKITLRAVIAPRTMNITNKIYDELDIIEIRLKGSDINQKVLEAIDSIIPRPVLFMIVHINGMTKYYISYKESHSKDVNKSKVIQYYKTQWNATPLKITGNSVKSIYINFIKQIEPSFDSSKPIAEAVCDTKDIAKIKSDIDKINNQIKNEPSIAKKQELARQRHLLEMGLSGSYK